MKKPFSSTLVLAAVFGVVLAWYLLWEQKYRPEQKKKEDQSKELVQIPSHEIQELVVERASLPQPLGKPKQAPYETLRFKKTADKWALVEPIQDPGDGASIQNLLTTLTTIKYEEVLKEGLKDTPEDWKPYGLAEPKIKITALKDKTKAELWVGDDTPVGNSLYIRKPGVGNLYQSPRSIRTSYEKKLEDFREKKILNWVRSDVKEMEIHSPGGEAILRQDDKGQWWLARQNIPADDTEWTKSLNAVLELRATDFASEKATELTKFGLSQPMIRVQMTKNPSLEKLQVLIGKGKDKYFAKRSDRDTVFEIAKDPIEKLSRPALAYMDKMVAKFNRFQVKRIVIEHLGSIDGAKRESVELTKSGPDWTNASDPAHKVNSSKVDGLLTGLQDVRLTEYSATEPKTPAMKIVLFEEKTEKGKPEETVSLSFAKLDEKKILLGRAGFNKGMVIKKSDFLPLYLGKSELTESPKPVADKKAEEKKSEKTEKM